MVMVIFCYPILIGVGQSFIEGSYLEEVESTKNGITYKLSKKIVFFYKESVVYLFAQLTEKKEGYFIV